MPVIGAGISRGAHLPDAGQLASWIASWAPPEEGAFSDEWNLMQVVDEIDPAQLAPEDLLQQVADHIKAMPLEPTPVANALVRVPSKLIVTLNYDLLLEQAAHGQDIPCRSLTNKDLEQVFEILASGDGPPDELVVLHLHGSVTDPESIVLDGEGYDRLAQKKRFGHVLLLLLAQRTLCFIGTRLDELHIRQKIRDVRSNRLHVLVGAKDSVEELVAPPAALSKKRDGILAEAYDDHPQLDGFVESLVTPKRAAIPTAPTVPAAPGMLPGYIPNVLRARGTHPTESDELAAAILGESTIPAPVSEVEVTRGHRTLVVGAPGSGKTELLTAVGEAVPADEDALLIRLRDVPTAPGAALTVLAGWAKVGEGVGGPVEVSEEALKQRRFHFLLDGLDEVPPAAQDAVARMVVAITRALPQHRFTVASRPVAAVSLFPSTEDEDVAGDSDWTVLELSPDRDWQRRYLDANGLRIEQLEEAMPALRDLRELLQLPFFLAQTVLLYEEGRLNDLPDLWALVQELVSSALAREGGLPLPVDQTRLWLRDVALAMHLRGRLAVTLQELEQVPIPEQMDGLVGQVDEISHALVLRLLLRESGENFSFVHRIVGESLAAEALAALGPRPELLDAIAPVRDELVSGVRGDWLVPLSFLLPHSPEWRQAIAERDPLQAARGVPSDAAEDERRAAAELIWRTYCEWRIWIWDYDAPDLIEDAEVLGRLLRTGGLEDVIADVRSGISNDSPQIQGNAIRVLSRVDPEWFCGRPAEGA